MKKSVLLFILLIFSIASFAQKKNYTTKIVGNWKLEKFPVHYFISPAKVFKENTAQNHRLGEYHEVDKNGEANGLYVLMRANGINPSYASYTYKGVIVYRANFFPGSNIIQKIQNMNSDDILDGPQIERTLKDGGGYNEVVTVYVNGDIKPTYKK